MRPIFRTTVRRKIVVGAKHALALCIAMLLFATGLVIIWYNRTGLTLTLLVAAGMCFSFAMLLAIPANFKQAVIFIVPYLPDAVAGGNRRTDPPLPPPPEGS